MSGRRQVLAGVAFSVSPRFNDDLTGRLCTLILTYGGKLDGGDLQTIHYTVQPEDGTDQKHMSPWRLWSLIGKNIRTMVRANEVAKPEHFYGPLDSFCTAMFKSLLKNGLELVPSWTEPVTTKNVAEAPSPNMNIDGIGMIFSPISAEGAHCISKWGRIIGLGETVTLDPKQLKIHNAEWDKMLRKVADELLSSMRLEQSKVKFMTLRGLDVVLETDKIFRPHTKFTLVVDLPSQRQGAWAVDCDGGWRELTNTKPECSTDFHLLRPRLLRAKYTIKAGIYCYLVYEVDVDVPSTSLEAPIAPREQTQLSICLSTWMKQQQQDDDDTSRDFFHGLGYRNSKTVPEISELRSKEKFILSQLKKMCSKFDIKIHLAVLELRVSGRRLVDRDGNDCGFETGDCEKVVLQNLATAEGKHICAGLEHDVADLVDRGDIFAGCDIGDSESEAEDEVGDDTSDPRKDSLLNSRDQSLSEGASSEATGFDREGKRSIVAAQNAERIFRRLVIVMTAPEKRPGTESMDSSNVRKGRKSITDPLGLERAVET